MASELWDYLYQVKHPNFIKPCLIFDGGLQADGHGRYRFQGKVQLAHRVAWFIEYNYWPTPQCNHHCDRPACCEITHLYEGTQKENMVDKALRSVVKISSNYRCGHPKGVDDIRNGRDSRGKYIFVCGPCTRTRKR